MDDSRGHPFAGNPLPHLLSQAAGASPLYPRPRAKMHTHPLGGPFSSLAVAHCQAHILSAEFGKHLLEVEDLLQKHKLMEADIAIQGDKVKAITAATLQFTEGKGEAKSVPSAEASDARSCPLAPLPAWVNLEPPLEFCLFPRVMCKT